jgi:membrane-associated phospholipid phosphatase
MNKRSRALFPNLKISVSLLLFFFQIHFSQASESDTLKTTDYFYIYSRPAKFHFLKTIPADIFSYSKATFKKKNILKISAMVAGTAALIFVDQDITDASKHLGETLHIAPTNDQKTFLDLSFHIGHTKIPLPLNGPFDLNSAMYYLGDGITHFSIAGGFYTYGLLTKDNRALQTASQLTETILTTGVVVQILKHLTGRQSPFTATAPGGVWRVFPNQIAYSSHVPHYDAFPSGHIATAMATVTVLAENYPEYRLIRPIGYTCMGLLTFAMLNNGVHWASDYPLGIALGYAFAKIAVNNGRQTIENDTKKQNRSMLRKLSPTCLMPSYKGISARWVF